MQCITRQLITWRVLLLISFVHLLLSQIDLICEDIPLALIQAFLYSICSYFLFGFQLEAGKFFIFAFTVFLCSVAMIELFRICGNIASNYFAASQFANVSLIVLLVYNGFLIPARDMHPWVCRFCGWCDNIDTFLLV